MLKRYRWTLIQTCSFIFSLWKQQNNKLCIFSIRKFEVLGNQLKLTNVVSFKRRKNYHLYYNRYYNAYKSESSRRITHSSIHIFWKSATPSLVQKVFSDTGAMTHQKQMKNLFLHRKDESRLRIRKIMSFSQKNFSTKHNKPYHTRAKITEIFLFVEILRRGPIGSRNEQELLFLFSFLPHCFALEQYDLLPSKQRYPVGASFQTSFINPARDISSSIYDC